MNEHIQTVLIRDRFTPRAEGCPFCNLTAAVEDDLCNRFLGEAVMSDEVRAEVNQKGFCDKHVEIMRNKSGKCGLSLQLSTRVGTLCETVFSEKMLKNPKKSADLAEKAAHSCIICEVANRARERYAKEIAAMFENGDSDVISTVESGGFCLSHYALLCKAGAGKKNFTAALTAAQRRYVLSLKEGLIRFSEQYDCKNAGKDYSDVKEILSRAAKLCGE